MKIHFLGTAAFEGIPSLFCRCETCLKAKQLGGRNIRTRTSVIIDGDLKVDFPPDTYLHMLRDGLDLENIKDLLFTHSHSDHIYPEDLVARLPGYAQSADHPIHIYAHDLPIYKIWEMLQINGGSHDKFHLHRVHPFTPVQTQTAVITPLPASHDANETCLIYYIEKAGKTIFYGHDSGDFPEATWEWLAGKKLDMAIFECTVGYSPYRSGHMNIDAVTEAKARMVEEGILKPDAQCAVTHFSHNGHLLYEQLCEIFEPQGIIVAYDGMILEI